MNTHFEGLVFKKSQGNYLVQESGRVVRCSISSLLRRELVYPTADPSSLRPVVVAVRDIRTVDPVAVGDRVRFVDAGHDTGMITEVLPRRSQISRLAAGNKPIEQVIVANLDQVVPVFAVAQPAPKWNLLDRYLVSAEASSLHSVICLTKTDLVDPGELDEIYARYTIIGYPVILTSAVTGQGIANLRAALHGKLSVLVGKSGVGKTTLLNALEPGLGLRVNAVSQKTGKGKHTTTSLELVSLDGNGGIVDTPGMRAFGLWQVGSRDLAGYFPEMRPYLGQCKFGISCCHMSEPGCAIKEAVQAGDISEQRYESLCRLMT